MRKDRIFVIIPINIKSQPGTPRAKSSAHSIHEDKEPFRGGGFRAHREKATGSGGVWGGEALNPLLRSNSPPH